MTIHSSILLFAFLFSPTKPTHPHHKTRPTQRVHPTQSNPSMRRLQTNPSVRYDKPLPFQSFNFFKNAIKQCKSYFHMPTTTDYMLLLSCYKLIRKGGLQSNVINQIKLPIYFLISSVALLCAPTSTN
jgi:hypothetical protein